VITEPAHAGLGEIRSQAHSNCVICSPLNSRGLSLKFATSEDGSVEACFDCNAGFEGYAGWVHGGIIASLMDGAMTNCMFAQGVPVVTAELNVRFRHPVAIDKVATVRAWVDQSSPPLYLLKAEVAQAEQIKATACGKFIEHRHMGTGRPVFG